MKIVLLHFRNELLLKLCLYNFESSVYARIFMCQFYRVAHLCAFSQIFYFFFALISLWGKKRNVTQRKYLSHSSDFNNLLSYKSWRFITEIRTCNVDSFLTCKKLLSFWRTSTFVIEKISSENWMIIVMEEANWFWRVCLCSSSTA